MYVLGCFRTGPEPALGEAQRPTIWALELPTLGLLKLKIIADTNSPHVASRDIYGRNKNN